MNRLSISSIFFILAVLFNGLMGQSDEIKGFSLHYDETKLDRSQTSPIVSYSATLKKSTPAVVAVTTKQVVRRLYPGGTDPIEDFLRRYYGLPRVNQPRVEEERVPAGIGSGVIVTPQGHTITNAHVITDPRTGKPVEEVTVKLSDKKEYEARIIGFDRSTDVAVLKIDAAEPLPHVTLANSDFMEVGDVVFAVGNPLGIGMTVTMGIVSATKKSELGVLEEGGYENFIQTDAAINRGNSGGALLDAKGRLIGINTAIISQTGASIGIGLAIPVNMVKKVLGDLVKGGGLKRGFLGVSLEESPTVQGAIIDSVEPNSPAEQAGLKPRDVIVKAAGKSVASVNQLRVAISQTPPGTRVLVKVLRNGKEMDFYVTLDLRQDSSSSPIPGILLEPLSPAKRNEFEIPSTVRGIVVTKSTGQAQTFKEGVVLVEINGYPVSTVPEVESRLKRGINRFYIWFRGKFTYLAYRVP
jgi:Do/DeqQ family serine protease